MQLNWLIAVLIVVALTAGAAIAIIIESIQKRGHGARPGVNSLATTAILADYSARGCR